MFGYVKPCKSELKMREYETFRGIYCGLCKHMGKRFGWWTRFTLNYDFVFLAMIIMSVNGTCPQYKPCRCIAHPFTKRSCALKCVELDVASAISMIMIYYNIVDDVRDGKGVKKIAAKMVLPLVSSARKKAMKDYCKFDDIIKSAMDMQMVTENEDSCAADVAAHPSAVLLSGVFSELSQEENIKRVLSHMGYLLGRWIYLIDALDDLEDDYRTGSFNPFLNGVDKLSNEAKERICSQAVESLNITVSELAATFELLDIKNFNSIIGNTIYLGLHEVQSAVITKKEKRKNDRSL